MIDFDAIPEIIEKLRAQNTDDAEVEVKSSTQKLNSDIWDSVSAFANTRGGLIILGLSEKDGFTLAKGFELDKIRDQFLTGMDENGGNAKLINIPQFELERVPFEGGQILVIEIAEQSIEFKPCFVKQKGKGNGSFKRVDDRDTKLSPTEIYELENSMFPSPADREAVAEASFDDLDKEMIDALIARKKKRGSKALRGAESYEKILERLNITNKEGEIRLAGLLALGSYPQQYCPKFIVDVAVHPGISKSLPGQPRFVDRELCEGSLGEVVRDAVRVVLRNLRTYSVVDGLGRRDVSEIPEEVLREVIANAVIHREYSARFQGQSVSVDVYSDKVVVTSPGGLWGGKTLDNIDNGESRCRNATLMRLMSEIPFSGDSGSPVEGEGSGILFVKNEMRSRGLKQPSFSADFDTFTVVLGRGGAELFRNRTLLQEMSARSDEPLTQLAEVIFLSVKRSGKKTVRELKNELGFDSDDIRFALSQLERDGHLERFGKDTYRFVDHSNEHLAPLDRAILSQLSQETPRSSQEIAELVGITISSTRYHIAKLVEEELIVPTAAPTSPKRKYLLS